jgi:hypothetical protein
MCLLSIYDENINPESTSAQTYEKSFPDEAIAEASLLFDLWTRVH